MLLIQPATQTVNGLALLHFAKDRVNRGSMSLNLLILEPMVLLHVLLAKKDTAVKCPQLKTRRQLLNLRLSSKLNTRHKPIAITHTMKLKMAYLLG